MVAVSLENPGFLILLEVNYICLDLVSVLLMSLFFGIGQNRSGKMLHSNLMFLTVNIVEVFMSLLISFTN